MEIEKLFSGELGLVVAYSGGFYLTGSAAL